MLFTSALQNVYCRTDGVHAGQSWMGGRTRGRRRLSARLFSI